MKKIAFNYGLKMFAGFAGLFLIVHLFGMSDNYNLRILNGIIHFGLLYLAIRAYRRAFPESAGNYVAGVTVGMYTSMVGVVLFTAFLFLFFIFFDPAFFARLQANSPYPEYINELTASLFIFVEGVVVSLIGSYLVTRVIDARLEEKGA